MMAECLENSYLHNPGFLWNAVKHLAIESALTRNAMAGTKHFAKEYKSAIDSRSQPAHSVNTTPKQSLLTSHTNFSRSQSRRLSGTIAPTPTAPDCFLDLGTLLHNSCGCFSSTPIKHRGFLGDFTLRSLSVVQVFVVKPPIQGASADS